MFSNLFRSSYKCQVLECSYLVNVMNYDKSMKVGPGTSPGGWEPAGSYRSTKVKVIYPAGVGGHDRQVYVQVESHTQV